MNLDRMINKIVWGDCLEVMKRMPDKCVDAVITDPPFGLNFPYVGYDDTIENLKHLIGIFLPEAIRISKLVAVFPSIANCYLYPQPDWIVSCQWDTTGSRGKFGWNQWMPLNLYGADLIGGGFNNVNGGLKSDVISVSGGSSVGFMRNAIETEHTCPKPIGIIKKIINRLTIDGMLILDPFLGSGTTAVAAYQLGRRFIGIERELRYIGIARRRLDAVMSQTKLW